MQIDRWDGPRQSVDLNTEDGAPVRIETFRRSEVAEPHLDSGGGGIRVHTGSMRYRVRASAFGADDGRLFTVESSIAKEDAWEALEHAVLADAVEMVQRGTWTELAPPPDRIRFI